MKANELRIGNLVKSGTGIYKIFAMSIPQILAIQKYDEPSDSQSNIYESNNTIIEPIPLTAKWFEKCGGKIGGEQVLFISMPKIKAELHFEMEPYGNVVVLKSDFGEFVPETIEYVHQLQNLHFALTGEELTIKEATK